MEIVTGGLRVPFEVKREVPAEHGGGVRSVVSVSVGACPLGGEPVTTEHLSGEDKLAVTYCRHGKLWSTQS